MKSHTADDARRRFGALLKAAAAEPVEITRHGARERYVLMSAQLFEVYEAMRRAHATDRILVSVNSALDRLAEGRDKEGIELIAMSNVLMKRWLAATGEKL